MSERNGRKYARRSLLSLLCCSLGWGQTATAFVIPVANSDLKVRWDNTVKYSAAYRLHNPSERVAGGIRRAGARERTRRR